MDLCRVMDGGHGEGVVLAMVSLLGRLRGKCKRSKLNVLWLGDAAHSLKAPSIIFPGFPATLWGLLGIFIEAHDFLIVFVCSVCKRLKGTRFACH